MNMKTESFFAVLKALQEREVEYILVGGLAVILQGVPRVTEDLNIFVAKAEANMGKLRAALHSVFADESIAEITQSELVQYPVIRYGTPENYYIAIMDRVGEAFTYDDLAFETITTLGVPIRVATKETRIKLKQDTLREIDKADVIMLREKMLERK